jgi:hypothetical protein
MAVAEAKRERKRRSGLSVSFFTVVVLGRGNTVAFTKVLTSNIAYLNSSFPSQYPFQEFVHHDLTFFN